MSVQPILLSQKKFMHRDNLTYPYEERGLQFGDGVYEVIRIYNGNYYLIEEHVNRLFRSAEAIKIELPFSKKELAGLLLGLLDENAFKSDGKLYLQVTRGSAPRNHVFPEAVSPNVYAYVQDFPRKPETIANGVPTITQRDTRWENCYIKSLNLLPNVLAKQEANENGCYESILHQDGLVTECSSSNMYLVKNREIFTHPATKRILHGCVRMRVEKFAHDFNIPFVEEPFSLDDISEAGELFLSSSTSEIMPVVKVDGKIIGDGKPGEIAKQLQEAYELDAGIKSKSESTR